jgi:hypothetical protein
MNSLPQNDVASAEALAEAMLDRRIDGALGSKPSPRIPEAFAEKVVARAMALPQRRTRRAPVGRTIAWASAAALTSALFALAPHAAPSFSSLSFDAELVLLLELAGLSWLLSRGFTRSASR